MQTTKARVAAKPALFSAAHLPKLNFTHISELTDNTGIIQHAVFSLPNRKEGYCIDDNSRALMLALWAGKDKKNLTAQQLLPVYLSFIHYMQADNGYFRNFMSYTKNIEEERGSEDSFGRTIMALGFLINEGSSHMLARTGADIFSKAYPHIGKLASLRGIANAVIGLCQYIKYNFPDDIKRNLVTELCNRMIHKYNAWHTDTWHWFEPTLTYDNAIIPLALLNAYEITQDETYLSVAFESMTFLESKVFHNGVLRPIGNQGWCKQDGGPAAQFDQQGIDVMAMVLYYQQAFRITREQQYLTKMYTSYQWFLGTNDLGVALYDPATGGCADGLQADGINLNQGAESTLAYWISHTVVAAALQE
jgi:hypothetical protein